MPQKRPKLRELALELEGLSWSEVKSMAIQLDMEFATLGQIEERYGEIRDRVLCAMETWLKADTKASWRRIIKALHAIRLNVLAEKIEREHYVSSVQTLPQVSQRALVEAEDALPRPSTTPSVPSGTQTTRYPTMKRGKSAGPHTRRYSESSSVHRTKKISDQQQQHVWLVNPPPAPPTWINAPLARSLSPPPTFIPPNNYMYVTQETERRPPHFVSPMKHTHNAALHQH